ncbi:MAG: hypothetical protein CVT90_01955 [Candidatus Altiarchaeales archaeon HGW-Altiarchaeales-3]|nr:MAG: hypothetical protein CVT90_01955 [Candidatus Altiarchaeales archaeon HGW-Altiarchaeales-3]
MSNRLLSEFIQECKNNFGNELISIILFGSYARKTHTEYSDIDLLVIARGLPKNRITRHKILNNVKLKFIYKYHVRISPVFMEPGDFSTKNINPLIYGILTGYNVIYDPMNFQNKFLVRLKPRIHEKKPIYIEDKQQWQIAEMIEMI